MTRGYNFEKGYMRTVLAQELANAKQHDIRKVVVAGDWNMTEDLVARALVDIPEQNWIVQKGAGQKRD